METNLQELVYEATWTWTESRGVETGWNRGSKWVDEGAREDGEDLDRFMDGLG